MNFKSKWQCKRNNQEGTERNEKKKNHKKETIEIYFCNRSAGIFFHLSG